MKKNLSQAELRAEYQRRSINYKTFDDLLTDEFGGDIADMHEFILGAEKQFDQKFQHDQWITDFINWMKNRKITLHE